ncbi:MAG: ferredoxin-thioredoxin reductase catalytic domain-containing protein [Halobacteriota archaeon]
MDCAKERDSAFHVRVKIDAPLVAKKARAGQFVVVRVDEVAKGLALRQEKFGKRYCQCRIITGDADEDRKIICPCVYHEEELKEHGMCHCKLFVTKEQ